MPGRSSKSTSFSRNGLLKKLRALAADEEGNFAVLTAFIAVVLVAAAGGAIDFSRAMLLRSDLQGKLDAAVLAAANAAHPNQLTKSKEYFQATITTLAESNPVAQFSMTPDGTISGKATATLKTSLLAVIGLDRLTVTVGAAAIASSSAGGPCILLLNTKQNALYVNSAAGIMTTKCEMHVHSAASPAATFTDGGNGLKLARICINGTHVAYNNQLNPVVKRDCDVAADPFADKLPSVSSLGCDSQLGGHLPDNKSVHKLVPGIYCHGVSANGSPRIELAPGLYVIKNGDWFFNSGTKLVGSKVTLFFADTSKIFFNGNVDVHLSAPTDGKYKDFLFFEPPGLEKTSMIINGNQNATLNGIIYLPSRNVHFNSTFAMNNDRTAVVLDKMSMDGTNWNLTPLSGSGSPGSGGGGMPRLVK